MPKTIKLESHLGSEELENRYRKAHDPVLRSHYQILWLISEGKSTTQVMEVTGYSRGWIQQLARRYNEGGPEALGDRRHGNPGARDRALLSEDQQEELKEALKKPPPDGGMWNSRKVDEWIERRSGKALSRKKQSGWEYMKRLGQSPKVPRPHHARADEHEQEAFKKALDEGDEAQGELPDGQGAAVVRGRGPFGFEVDCPQGMESHRSKTAREDPPALRVDLPLRLRAPQQWRGPLAHLAHRKGGGVLDGFGALRKGSGSGKEKTHPARGRSGRMAHGKEGAKGARRDTP